MIRIRTFSFDFPKNWLMISMSIFFGLALGLAISAEKYKTWAILLVLPTLCIFKTIPERFKFWLLVASIPLSLVQIPRIPLPYGTQISEAILLFLTLDEILFFPINTKKNIKPLVSIMIYLLGMFAVAGLIANIRSNNIITWNVYCLLPLFIFFLISRKVRNIEDASLVVYFSLLTIIGFIAIIQLAVLTGNYVIYDPLDTETYARYYRLADGIVAILGPIRLYSFATRIGAIAALGLPICVLLWLENKGNGWIKSLLLILTGVLGYVIILSATRGSLIAAVCGTFLAIMISGRFRSPMFIGAATFSIILFSIWGDNILKKLPSYNIQRLLTLTQGVSSIGNFHQRMDVLLTAWNLTLKNPLGVGFGYLFHMYQLDDAIMYAIILQGTGILGAIAFVLIVGALIAQLGLKALKFQIGQGRDLASLGIGILATGLLAGVSSQSILFEPVHSFVFWILMATCFYGIEHSNT